MQERQRQLLAAARKRFDTGYDALAQLLVDDENGVLGRHRRLADWRPHGRIAAGDLGETIVVRNNDKDSGAIGPSITDLDTTTEQNAALAEQSTAAADSLKSEAERLNQTVAQFQLAEHARRA